MVNVCVELQGPMGGLSRQFTVTYQLLLEQRVQLRNTTDIIMFVSVHVLSLEYSVSKNQELITVLLTTRLLQHSQLIPLLEEHPNNVFS